MKKVLQKKALVGISILVLVLLSTAEIMAQSVYLLSKVKDDAVKISGTSNVHDWTMTTKGIESQGIFKFNSKDELVALSSFNFNVQAKSLKSGKSTMDSRTYKTILADEFPKITFQLKSANITQQAGNRYQVQANGNLTIAGATQAIVLNVLAIIKPDGSINCTGMEKLKLTDYKIDPPSFMLGAMKVGNELIIRFDLDYNKAILAK